MENTQLKDTFIEGSLNVTQGAAVVGGMAVDVLTAEQFVTSGIQVSGTLGAGSLNVSGATAVSGSLRALAGLSVSGTLASNNVQIGGGQINLGGPGVPLILSGTGAFQAPAGNTLQRPDAGNIGEIRYNSDSQRYEFGIGGVWIQHVLLQGDTMLGALTLASDPQTSLQPVTLQFLRGNTIPLSAVGSPNGVATLNSGGTIPLNQMPPGFSAGTIYQGVWNAATNTPPLSSSVGTSGFFYVVNASGTTNLNGITSWNVGDEAIFGAGVWDKTPYSSTLGSMATQFANNVQISGGGISGQTNVGFTTQDAIQPNILTPDWAWTVQDYLGNIVLGVDYAGNAVADNLVATSATLAQALINDLTLTSGIASPVVAVSNLSFQTNTTPLPDLINPLMDVSGNVVAGYGADGTFYVSSLNSLGGLVVNGNPFTGSSVPSDSLDVRNTKYGAVGDGLENFCYATTSGNTLSIYNFSGVMSLTQTTPSTVTLTVTGAFGSGIGFQPYNVGQMVYFSTSGYALQAEVIEWINGQTVILDASGITPQTSVSGTWTCPSFTTDRVGKHICVDGMGQDTWWAGGVTQEFDTNWPIGTQMFIGTITTITSPNQVIIQTSFPYQWTAHPTRLLWGTDDTNSCAEAAQAALASNIRKLYFSGNGNLYLLLSAVSQGAGKLAYLASPSTDTGALLNGVIWVGDNSKVYACNLGGLQLFRQIAQEGSEGSRVIDRRIFGRASLKRAAKLIAANQPINLFISGDSQGLYNPEGQSSSWVKDHPFVELFKRANPEVQVNVYVVAVGGATITSMVDPNQKFNNASVPTQQWTIPRPISGTIEWIAAELNANQTGSGPPIYADVHFINWDGGNDSLFIDGSAIFNFVNQILAVNHGDAYGPTDIILHCDGQSVISTTNNGNTGGVVLPDPYVVDYRYMSGLTRSIAQNNNWALVDIEPILLRGQFGVDPLWREMRNFPSYQQVASPTLPLNLPSCNSFASWITLPGSNDASVWAAMEQLNIQISPNPGGQLMMRLGANGHIWVGSSTWGLATLTTGTITSGQTALTVGMPTTLTNQIITMKNWPQLQITSGTPFSSANSGQCFVAPTGDVAQGNRQLQRNFVRDVPSSSALFCHDCCNWNGGLVAVSGLTLTIGGAQFIPQDSYSMPDVVIFYPDGTIFNTQVASGGYGSLTGVTLATPAPETLSGQAVQMFVGRMGIKWFDTGIIPSPTQTLPWELGITRNSLLLGYCTSGFSFPVVTIDINIERFGANFCPVFTPQNSQSINLYNTWLDTDKTYYPTATPWEIRGVADTNADFYLGGAGGHPSSKFWSDIMEPTLACQDLSAY